MQEVAMGARERERMSAGNTFLLQSHSVPITRGAAISIKLTVPVK